MRTHCSVPPSSTPQPLCVGYSAAMNRRDSFSKDRERRLLKTRSSSTRRAARNWPTKPEKAKRPKRKLQVRAKNFNQHDAPRLVERCHFLRAHEVELLPIADRWRRASERHAHYPTSDNFRHRKAKIDSSCGENTRFAIAARCHSWSRLLNHVVRVQRYRLRTFERLKSSMDSGESQSTVLR